MVQDTQQNDELNKKRQEAARAMSANFKSANQTVANTAPSATILQEKTEAKPKNSLNLAELRLKAQLAMEGDERRKKREEALRKEREALEAARAEEERKKKEAYEQERLKKEQIAQQLREKEEREEISKQLKEQVDNIRESGAGLRNIRTLKADTDSLIKSQNISLVGIAIKEEERRRKNKENQTISSKTNLSIALASLVLIILTLGIAFYIYNSFYAGNSVNVITGKSTLPESLVFAEKTKTLDTTNIATDDLISRLKNEIKNPPDLLIGQVENLIFTKTIPGGQASVIETSEFFTILGSKIPDNLLRTLDKSFMYGILSSAENASFVIIKTESHDKGLAGMLEWEKGSLIQDMYQVLTSLRPGSDLLTKPFDDMVLRNIDTRILKDSGGTIRIIYGFLDGDKTLVIAGSQQAFVEALRRFNTPKPLEQ